MIYGVGVDLIEVARVAKQIETDNRFKERIFTKKEITYCESKKYKAENYAARFAAKEAFFKALGTGWRDGMVFIEVEIINDELGKPKIFLSGKTKQIAENKGINNIHVSLSHIRDFASSIVTLEK